MNIDFLIEITKTISDIGKQHKQAYPINEIPIFEHYFQNGNLIEPDKLDGKFTRREIVARLLLLGVVLDQGPDIIGVRKYLKEVITSLYQEEIRILHKPIDFFKELNISIDKLISKHNSIKEIRKYKWAEENKTNPEKYSLFFAQSMRGIVPTKQVLDYAVHRWGSPLCLFILLEKDLEKTNKRQPFVEYIESYESAERMARQLKNHNKYGLGSAIGDKACHLFAKMYVSTFKLYRNKNGRNKGWSEISYELPFDSNAGRVLFRTGFLLELANLEKYEKWNVIQRGKGKGGLNYIRVTNLRGKKIKNFDNEKILNIYREIVTEYLKLKKNKTQIKYIEIQHFPNLLLYYLRNIGVANFSIANFDDGLIYIGTKFCFNHEEPKCSKCPLKNICKGNNDNSELIEKYRT
jgi:hypothetical protein